MKSLSLTFKGSFGKTHVLKFNYVASELDEATVRAAMDTIAKQKLFVSNDEELYVTPVSAAYTDTNDHVIFTTA